MPELGGIEATQIIRANFPPEKQPIIIGLTADAFDANKKRCFSAGMNK
jgi:CheY-like chemotaxis protein